ncbi:DUF502 domain-containing protein [Methyloligella sp. 2.7D]|uniref:DUF502 domain-containing protein n=1 Tax=unclassified Methyloligella TaxID=2625955 RepID=UPI00157CD2DD|nr:DUF502 domain-containing protein [Methyloligella sp. GL2]QKP77666.1 DUF502 domain-containing protein [Methyloligella sp. GL2]
MEEQDEDDVSRLERLRLAGERHSSHFGARLRGYFLTGLIIVGPVAITIYVVWSFVNLVDTWVKPLIPKAYLPETYLPINVPGVGLIVGIVALMLIGALTANLFGRTLFSYGEMMLDRMPVVRGVYRLLKQIFQSVFADTDQSFKKVGLIEFPRKGVFAVVFISGETPNEIKQKAGNGDRLITVFMPNAPNPTTGFVMFMPEKDVTVLDMPIEDGVKLVISAGLVSPDKEHTIESLVEQTRGRRRRKQKALEAEAAKDTATKDATAPEDETAS